MGGSGREENVVLVAESSVLGLGLRSQVESREKGSGRRRRRRRSSSRVPGNFISPFFFSCFFRQMIT